MKREIEFRGKLSHSGVWVLGSLLKIDNKYHIVTESDMYEDGHHICQESDTPTWVDPDTVGEFTGMMDKHGKKIFEGDIVCTNGCEEFFEVIYDAPDFCLKKNSSGYRFLNHPENFEVIGNIHDNPELLKRESID